MGFERKILLALVGGYAAAKEHPVSKIVNLLRDMKDQLEKDAEDDAAVYKKLQCWCTDGKTEKEQAIATANTLIPKLEAEHEGAASQIEKLNALQKTVRVELRKHQDGLAKATENRMAARREFGSEEAENIETIAAVKQAVAVLKKHNPQFAQLKSVAKRIRMSAEAHPTNAGMLALKGFMSGIEKTSLLQQPNFQSYAGQSGQIFGVLQNMQENMEADLSDARKQDQEDEASFQELKKAKEEQIAAMEKKLENAKASYAEQKEKNASAYKEMEDMKAQLKLDTEALGFLEKQCQNTDEDYARRVKGRSEEIAAVQETITILNSDDSFNSFSKSVGFLQIGAVAKRQQRALQVLRRLNSADPKISLIQTYAELNAFTKVKAAIKKMVEDLKAQQKEEVDDRDACVQRLNDNELEMQATTDKKQRLDTDLQKLAEQQKALTASLKDLEKQNAEAKVDVQRAGDDRSAEHEEYRVGVADQRITKQILNKALDRMKQKYGFLQQPGAAHTALGGQPPAKFKEYEANAGGNAVVSMIEKVIADAAAQEKELVNDETKAQSAYAQYVRDQNREVAHREKMIATQTQELAKTKEEIENKTEAKGLTLESVKALMGENKDIHSDCDFLLNNFDTRQESRQAEMDALSQASNILSGMQ